MLRLRLRSAGGERQRKALALSGIVGAKNGDEIRGSDEGRLHSYAPLIRPTTWTGKHRVESLYFLRNRIRIGIQEYIKTRAAQ